MTDLNYQRLAKVFALMGSPVEGEAIAAFAKASSLMQAAGISWESLAPKMPSHPPAQSVGLQPRESASMAAVRLRDILRHPDLSERQRSFAEDVRGFHRRKGTLTPNQCAAILTIWHQLFGGERNG